MHRCPVCDNPHAGIHGARKHYRECPACGLVWRRDRATLTETTGFYQAENPADAVTESKRALHEAMLAEAEKRLGGKGRLLDMGCGTGDFLVTARERGWDCVGVEPVKWQVNRARERGLEVVAGTVENLSEENKPFDLVTYWDVIMMVAHPRDEMTQLLPYIKRGGMVYMRVRQHQVVRAVEKCWRIIGRPLGIADPTVYHPFNFSPKTLHTLSKRMGMLAQVRNGRLTSGDAYGVSKKNTMVRLLKLGVEKSAFMIERASLGHVLASPTMELWARPLE